MGHESIETTCIYLRMTAGEHIPYYALPIVSKKSVILHRLCNDCNY